VKVTSGQQSLILAGEYPVPRGTSGSLLDAAVGLAAKSAVSTRVTVVAARPDAALVLLRADYSSRAGARNDAPAVGDGDPEPEAPHSRGGELVPTSDLAQRVLTSVATVQGNAVTRLPTRTLGVSSYLNPAATYARTQGGLGEAPKGIHIDVRA
jgi:hypothetical protein